MPDHTGVYIPQQSAGGVYMGGRDYDQALTEGTFITYGARQTSIWSILDTKFQAGGRL